MRKMRSDSIVEFVEAPAFTELLQCYMNDELPTLQSRLAEAPDCGRRDPCTAVFRKMRWAERARGKGQRGGLRVIYYQFRGYKQSFAPAAFSLHSVRAGGP